MKHCIFVYSDYVSGKRIGYHLQNNDGMILLRENKKMEEELKKENPNIKYGVYFLKTEEDSWDSVIKKDSFFKDVEVKTKKIFFKCIKKNDHLKKDDERDILNITILKKEDILSKISLISRRENLKLLKYELEELELNNLEKIQNDIKNSISEKEEILEKMKILIPAFILTKEFFKTIEAINKSTEYYINKMKKENFSEIYTSRLKLKELDSIIYQYMEIIKNLSTSDAKSAKYIKKFIAENEKNRTKPEVK